MAKVLVGEAAVRIVPTLRGFHSQVRSELKRQPHKLDVRVNPQFALANAEIETWKKFQRLRPLEIPVTADIDKSAKGLRKELRRVEHIFKRSSISRALRLNVKVIGLDALPALAYAAGNATAGIDALGKALLALPGISAGALGSIAALATGLRGIGDAFKEVNDSADDHDKALRDVRDAQRDLQRAQRDLNQAIRDQKREIQDLNMELRRASLDEADALLNVQEAAQRLREGGFKSLTEFQRAQLTFLRSVDDLHRLRVENNRLMEDTALANAKGIEGSDAVVDALDKVSDALDKLSDAQKEAAKSNFQGEAMAKLSDNARRFVEAVKSVGPAWDAMSRRVQDSLTAGWDQEFLNLSNRILPGLEVGLSRVASGLNTSITELARSIVSDTSLGFLDNILRNTETGLTNLSRAMRPFTEGFLRMASVGSDFLPRLGAAFERVFTRFDEWTKRITEDGSLARWIDEGLDSLTSLGNATLDLFHVVRRISEAYAQAAGYSGGFLTSLERGLARLSEYLDDPTNFQGLVSYFSQARTFMNELWNAFKNIRPFIKDLVDIAREWSSWMFSIIGGFTKVASLIERNTGLLKPLLFAYMTLRTVRPVIDALTTGWRNYGIVVGALGKFKYTERIFGPIAQGAVIARGELDKMKKSADEAGKKVGGANRGSLLTAAKGLAMFVGPGAGFMAAVGFAAWGIEKLGEAHRNAAEQARQQEEALRQLKATLDEVTGSATMRSVQETAKQFQSFPIFGIGNVNANELAQKLGINPSELVSAAADPTQVGQIGQIMEKLVTLTKRDLESDPDFQHWKPAFLAAGLSTETVARAAFGDPEALEKFRKFEQDMTGLPFKPPEQMTQIDRMLRKMVGDKRMPTLTDLVQRSEAAQLGHVFYKAQTSQGAAQQTLVEAQNIATGVDPKKGWALAPAAQSFFGAWSPDQSPKVDGATGKGAIILNRVPDQATMDQWQQDHNWDVEVLPNGRAQVTINAGDVGNFLIPKMARGGIVGGVGTGTSDSNLAWLSKGEFVSRKAAVDYYGKEFFDDLNGLRIPKFNIGGMVWPQKPIIPPPPPAPSPSPILTPQSISSYTPPPTPVHVPDPPKPTTPIVRDFGPPSASIATRPSPSLAAPPSPGPFGKIKDFIVGSTGLWRITGDLPPAGYTPDVGGKTIIPNSQRPKPEPPKPEPPKPQRSSAAAIDTIIGTHRSLPKPPKSTPTPTPKPSTPPKKTSSTSSASSTGGVPTGTPAASVHTGSGAAPGVGATHMGTGMPPGPASSVASPYAVASMMPAMAPYMFQSNAINPFLSPGMPLQNLGKGSEAGLQVNTIAVKRFVENMFPQIQEIGGVRPDGLKWHPNGLAIDVMIPGGTTRGGRNPQGKALGDAIWAAIAANADALGVDMNASLWQTDQGGDHFDHLHIATTGGGFPKGGEQFVLPAGAMPMQGVGPLAMAGPMLTPALLQSTGLQLGPDGLPTAGQGVDPITDFFKSIGLDPSKPGLGHLAGDKVTDFLTGQAKSVGSQVLQIGLGLVSGLTGLDFSSLVGHGQTIGNFILDKATDGEGSSSPTSLNDLASQAMSNWTVGGLPLSGQGGFDPWLGADMSGLLADPSGLANQALAEDMSQAGQDGNVLRWMPLVKAVVMRLYQAGLLTKGTPNEWVAAVMRQMKLESSGNPAAINLSDSNSAKGTPSKGLMQVIQPTFDRFFPEGLGFTKDINDPAANIAAAILYTQDRYGGPHGMTGVKGYRRGGPIRGRGGVDSILARVSRGEFLNNARSVAYYGPDFFARLNAMQIPREALPGFNTGAWWNPFQPQPQPMPGPAPQQPAQVPGPLPLAPPGAAPAPSTGGVPGQGAPAPAPDPGTLPQVSQDALAGVGSAIGAAGAGAPASSVVQPGATPTPEGDPRATLGAPPQSQEHLHPALSKGIHGAASTIGSWAGTAASLAGMAAGGASGNPALAQAGGAVAAGVQAGAAIGGQIAAGAANILSSLLVGTLTNGTTASASGTPLLPNRQQQGGGVRVVQRAHYGDINVVNLDEYRRVQQRMDAQAAMPYIGKYEA